jgi:RES domain-containing protein
MVLRRSGIQMKLKVPSVIIDDSCNYIINANHPHFEREIKIVEREVFVWDNRLFDKP